MEDDPPMTNEAENKVVAITARPKRKAKADQASAWDKAKPATGSAQAMDRIQFNFDEMFERYTLIYGTKEVWDATERAMIDMAAFRMHYSGGAAKFWQEGARRKTLPRSAVVFDPAREPDSYHINLFKGFPIAPAPGKCEALVGLLRSLCGTEEVFEYVCNWIAYPLQNPGFKLRTALVFHGMQGVGKNLFFEALGAIYGEHFSVIGQAQVDAKHNEWASGRLLVVADEVLTRAELSTTKGTIKSLITGQNIQIEPKYLSVRSEANRMNIVFFSNEAQPVSVEDGDRRFLVVWCDDKRSREFYDQVAIERDGDGLPALYDWFLKRDVSGFNPFGAPPVTQAKKDLIELGRSSPMAFVQQWLDQQFSMLPLAPARTTDLHSAYLRWCVLVSDRYPFNLTRFVGEVRRMLPIARKRIGKGSGVKQQAVAFPETLLFWETARGEEPEGEFYERHVIAFSDGLKQFKSTDLNGSQVHHV